MQLNSTLCKHIHIEIKLYLRWNAMDWLNRSVKGIVIYGTEAGFGEGEKYTAKWKFLTL